MFKTGCRTTRAAAAATADPSAGVRASGHERPARRTVRRLHADRRGRAGARRVQRPAASDAGCGGPARHVPRSGRVVFAQGLRTAHTAMPRRLSLLHLCACAATGPGAVPADGCGARDRAGRRRPRSCKEVLFTLGDKPELRYPAARDALDRLGHDTTLSYLAEAARTVLDETGLLPHVNPGCLTAADLAASAARVDLARHHARERVRSAVRTRRAASWFSRQDPAARLATIRLAGEQRIPFTTGILIGIGETRRERVEALLALRALHDTLRAPAGNHHPELPPQARNANGRDPAAPLEEHLWTIAVARLLFRPSMNIQAPPNLNAGALARA